MLNFLKKPNSAFIYHNFNKFFSTKLRQGATKNTKDSAGKRLGVKKFGGEEVLQNQIIVSYY
jgi:hypothetical protein